jgi:hypothetical protein
VSSTIELADDDAPPAAANPAPTTARAAAPSPARAASSPARPKAAAADRDDALMRETLLVGEARGALMRGDPRAALSTIRAARNTGSHALEPEELALEAKALRALGKDTEATAAESTLRARYPDHALAR